MSEDIRIWDGDEWEDHCVTLLKARYGPKFHRLSPKHGGDFGLEGYSIDGRVYQCYASEGQTVKERYNGALKKLNDDVQKFIDNRADLEALFRPLNLAIIHWILLVPKEESARLVQHANQWTEHVRRAGLSYVSSDFLITVENDDCFHAERE